jgi:hypothetical protein
MIIRERRYSLPNIKRRRSLKERRLVVVYRRRLDSDPHFPLTVRINVFPSGPFRSSERIGSSVVFLPERGKVGHCFALCQIGKRTLFL